MARRTRSKTALLVAYGIAFTGVSLIFLSILSEGQHWPSWFTGFTRDLGLLLAAVLAGTIIHEKLLRDEMVQTITNELDKRFSTVATDAGAEVHRLFCDRPPGMTGLGLISDKRRNFSGYYEWVIDQKRQELFFAGRSVLHRIDADIRQRTGQSADEILFRKLSEGSQICILLLDPRMNILGRLSDEEGQRVDTMLSDLATSLGICERLYKLLDEKQHMLKPDSDLTVRIYDRIPYFAYHRQDDQAIVGFYFLSSIGSSSAAYEIADEHTKKVFQGHFDRILSEASDGLLVEYSGAQGRATFNKPLFDELHGLLGSKLGKDTTDELMRRVGQ
jgi:hypothetical protein